MPPPNPGQRLMPSIVDRLLDPESMGSPSSPGYSEREMLNAVRADLEELLNTRRTAVNIPEGYVEVPDSIANYGLTDLVNYSATRPEDFAELAKMVSLVIHRFEPRLRKVRVKVIRGDRDTRSVRFHIDAQLNVDPSPEVGFETIVELTTGRATVRDEGATK